MKLMKMQLSRIISAVTIFTLFVAGLVFSTKTQPAQASAACNVTDEFGYQLTCTNTGVIGWVDVSSTGERVPFNQADDELSALIPIGFTFKYYEYSYNGIYVSSNGALFFTQISNTETLNIDRIPRSKKPNNLLAPFWADLYVGGQDGNINKGEVFYKTDGTGDNQYFVIQYKDVSLLSEGTNKLNFEVILRKNGDIDFLYKTLTGSLNEASVGIEDKDGVIGIQHLYQEAGLDNGLVLQFKHPGNGPRVKALSEAESSLVIGGKAEVRLTFRNAGDGPDTIQFPPVTLTDGWQYRLLNPVTKIELPDTDKNGAPESGVLAPGEDVSVLVRITAPKGANASDTVEFTLVAQSKANLARTAYSDLRFAVPSPFAYAFSNLSDINGMTYGITSSNNRSEFKLVVNHTSKSMGIIRLTGNRIFYIWEKAGTNSKGISTTYLTSMILKEFGGVSRNAWVPTNNDYNDVFVFTTDLSPSLAEDPGRNNHIGLFYKHDQNFIDNLYLTVLDTGGNIIPAFGNFKNITQQGTAKPYDYSDPVITATSNGNFVLAWTATYSDTVKKETNIWTAAYNTSTLAQVKAPSKVTNAITHSKAYGDPVLVPLDDGRVFLGYTVFESAGSFTGYVEWIPLNSSGSPTGSAVNYKSTAPSNNPEAMLQKDAAQLFTGGPILLAWVDSGTEKIHAILVNNAMTGNFSPRVEVSSPNNRAPGNLSVTNTREGYGVLLWEDVTSSQYIFYSLLSSIGELLTGPTSLVKTEQVGSQTIAASLTAQGLIPIDGYNLLNLPAVMNKYNPGLMSADADEEEIWQP